MPQDPVHLECDHLFHCGAGNAGFVLSCDGKFRLCPSLTAPGTTFDLRKGSLRQAWTEFVPRIREVKSNNPEYLEKCRNCGLINLCFWCPATAFLEMGELDRPIDYFCRIAHERAKIFPL
jgi:radical SAM protein with 4Fe4S-binding SPASM domain